MKRILLALAIVAAPQLARAESHSLVDNNKHKTIACKKGDDVAITGNKNTVTVTGECAAVAVAGNDNTVTIEAAGAIATPGNKNTVTWKRGLDGKDPAVSTTGNGNNVSKAK